MSGATLTILALDLTRELLQAWPARAPSTLALARLLARADLVPARPHSHEHAVLAAFGYAPGPDQDLPIAALMAAYDCDLPAPRAGCVCADPVHLRADPNRLILVDASTAGLTADEADELLAVLNAAFDPAEVRFVRGGAPQRWYAVLPEVPPLALPSPRQLNGRATESALAALKRAGRLNRLLTEAQMVLHGAATNAAREAAGRPPINSVWFWGAGSLPPAGGPAPAIALGDDDLLAACARAAGIPHLRAADLNSPSAASGSGSALVLATAADCTPEAFLARLLEPALAALATSRYARVVVQAGVAEFGLERAMRRRWWRRPQRVVAALTDMHGERGPATYS